MVNPKYIPFFPETPYPSVDALPKTDPITNEWQRFYAVPRGFHSNDVAALLLLQTYHCFNLMPWLISMRLHLVQFFLFMATRPTQ